MLRHLKWSRKEARHFISLQIFILWPRSLGSGLTKILGIHSSITWVLCFKTELHSLLPDLINRFRFLHLFKNFKSQFNKFPENNSAKNCVHMYMVAKGGQALSNAKCTTLGEAYDASTNMMLLIMTDTGRVLVIVYSGDQCVCVCVYTFHLFRMSTSHILHGDNYESIL